MGLDNPQDLPTRVRVLSAVVPAVFVGLAVIADPAPWVMAAALLTIFPWLAFIARLPLPGWLCGLVTTAGVAWLMKDWARDDLTVMILVYGVGMQAALFRLRESLALLVLDLGVPLGWQLGSGYHNALGWMIGMGFAWGCGFFFRKQQEAVEDLQRAQRALADKAVSNERRRIAREVHDVVAHSLAVTMLHLTGARLALADGETAEAQAALSAAERLGRSSMTGIRQAVGLLADGRDEPSWGPEPDVRDIPALVDDYRRAGVAVELELVGDDTPLDPALGLAVFRLVQESLANAARHAPGQPVHAEISRTTTSVRLTVTNPVVGPFIPSPAGHGVVGMRERTEQLDGIFDAGVAKGIWRLQALLPVTIDAEAEPR